MIFRRDALAIIDEAGQWLPIGKENIFDRPVNKRPDRVEARLRKYNHP